MHGKICCFFGHRDAPDTLADDLYTAAEEMVLLEGVTTFLVGGHGNFDFLAAQTYGNCGWSIPISVWCWWRPMPLLSAVPG